MKKGISCMICALLLVGCMAGCGSTGGKSGSGNGIKIMMSLSQGDDFRNTIVEQAKKTAQEKGATLDVYDEDGSLESQVEHIKQAAKEKYDVILCGPVNADTALELESLQTEFLLSFITVVRMHRIWRPENICMWVPMKM